MRKFLLYSSALVVSGLLSGAAEAACIQTPTCSSLGYTSSSSCTGGTKCPFGNAWNCTVVDLTNKITEITNKITTIEEKITEIEENGGGGDSGTTTPDYTNCAVGAILYSDKTCSADLIAGKTQIGVVFNSEEHLAIALKTSALAWSTDLFDIPLLGGNGYDSDGQYNTRIGLEYCQANDKVCPAFEYAASYQTEGTEAGDWYLPAAAEMITICKNTNTLNSTLRKIGGSEIASRDHWTSSESTYSQAWKIDYYMCNASDTSHKSSSTYNVRPVLAF